MYERHQLNQLYFILFFNLDYHFTMLQKRKKIQHKTGKREGRKEGRKEGREGKKEICVQFL